MLPTPVSHFVPLVAAQQLVIGFFLEVIPEGALWEVEVGVNFIAFSDKATVPPLRHKHILCLHTPLHSLSSRNQQG